MPDIFSTPQRFVPLPRACPSSMRLHTTVGESAEVYPQYSHLCFNPTPGQANRPRELNVRKDDHANGFLLHREPPTVHLSLTFDGLLLGSFRRVRNTRHPKRRWPFVLVILLAWTISAAHAAITRPAIWKLSSIEQTYSGAWCFTPGADAVPTQRCQRPALQALLDLHTNNTNGAGLSIAYYDLNDGSALGGAEWHGWNDTAIPVGLCMSGTVAAPNGSGKTRYLTVCRFATCDDDQDLASAHTDECTIAQPQQYVADGCYSSLSQKNPAEPAFSKTDAVFAVIGVIASVIGIWGAIWATMKLVRKRRALASRSPPVNEVVSDLELEEGVPAHVEPASLVAA